MKKCHQSRFTRQKSKEERNCVPTMFVSCQPSSIGWDLKSVNPVSFVPTLSTTSVALSESPLPMQPSLILKSLPKMMSVWKTMSTKESLTWTATLTLICGTFRAIRTLQFATSGVHSMVDFQVRTTTKFKAKWMTHHLLSW